MDYHNIRCGSDRNKRNKTNNLQSTVSQEVLAHAAKTSLETSGHRNASCLLSEVMKSPKRAKKYKKTYAKSLLANNAQLSPFKALSILLPISSLSEEAGEARNKHFRMYRYNFTRKFSRVDCNTHILNRLLLSSDPLLISLRQKPKRNMHLFPKETIRVNMLLPPEEDSDSEEYETEEMGESNDEP